MSILPLIPILVLLGGALAVISAQVLRLRLPDEIASIASLIALAAMVPLAAPQPVETLVSSWQPLSVFGAPTSLRVDRLNWPIGLTAALVCASTLLTGLAYPGQRRFAPRALALGMTAALIASTFAANLLTVALAWGLFDVLFAIGVLARGGEENAGRRAAFAVGFSAAATMSLWIAALVIGQEHRSTYWHLMELSDTARGWLGLAAVLRLGLYPLNPWLSTAQEDAPGRLALFYILPPLAGLHILIRMSDLDALPNGPVLIALAAVSILLGGALARLRGRSRDALPYLSLGGLGVVVLSGLFGYASTSSTAIFINGAVSWGFALTVLNVSRGFDRSKPWWSLASGLSVATLVGLPASAGFAVRTNLAAGAARSAEWPLILIALAGEALIFAGLMRVVGMPATGDAPKGWRAAPAYVVALALAGLPVFLMPALGRSIVPELTPPSFEVVLPALGVLGSLLYGLPIVLALVIEWNTRNQSNAFGPNLEGLIGLDWFYSLVFRFVNWAARQLAGVAALLEGDTAMLWALLFLIVGYVVLSGVIP